MYPNYKLRRFNKVVFAVAIIMLLVGGVLFAIPTFVAPASEPVEAVDTDYYSSNVSHYYNGTSTSYQNYVYCRVYVNCDSLGISGNSSITFPTIQRYSTSIYISNYLISSSSSADRTVYWYPTSLNLTIRLTGYSWVNSITQFSATWGFSYYSDGTSWDTALSDAKKKAGNTSYGGSMTYTRSGSNFTTSASFSDAGRSNYFYSDHGKSNSRYAVLYIDLEKPASSVQQIAYTLSFDSNGGNTINNRITTYYGNSIGSSLPTPYRNSYTFDGWYIGTKKISSSTRWTWTSDQIAQAHWTFSGPTLSASVGTEGGGTISGAGTEYENGATVRVQAIPNEGYAFDYWMMNNNRMTDNPLEFVITTDTTLVAYFREVPVVIVSFTGGTGTSSSQSVGTMQYVVATPQSGYYVSTITVDGISFPVNYYEAVMYGAGNANRVTYFAKDSTNSISMSFDYLWGRTEVVINLTTVRPQLQVPPSTGGGFGVSGVVATATSGGEARITGFDTEDEYVHFSAISYSGYRFAGWTASDGTNLSAYGATADIPMNLVKDKVITANFEPDPSNSSSDINDSNHNAGDEFN